MFLQVGNMDEKIDHSKPHLYGELVNIVPDILKYFDKQETQAM